MFDELVPCYTSELATEVWRFRMFNALVSSYTFEHATEVWRFRVFNALVPCSKHSLIPQLHFQLGLRSITDAEWSLGTSIALGLDYAV